ncbi:MAG: hypothetical protein HYU57_03550, partial [Micavibrio aeruginosavorus]|nr:hypothetical protein [Micavibrio aeruginosavorus]
MEMKQKTFQGAIILTCCFCVIVSAKNVTAQWIPKNMESNDSVEFSPVGQEETRTGRKFVIGEQAFFSGDVIEDFLEIAFSEKLWNEDAANIRPDGFGRMIDWYSVYNWDIKDPSVKKHYQEIKQKMPWIADYFYYPSGLPKHNAINKWEDEISIAFGLPGQRQGSENPGNYDLASRKIKELLPEISRASGLKAVFLNDADASLNDSAKIRIVFADVWPKRNWNKSSGYKYEIYDYEEGLFGGVLFQTKDAKKMDAYMLPDQNNELGMAICKIKNGLSPDEIESLITECIIRSLGLPDRAKGGAVSVLSGDQARQITPYDRFMIKLLYC